MNIFVNYIIFYIILINAMFWKKDRSDKILDLDVIKDVFNNLKESKFMQNFTKELSEYVENNIENDSRNRVTSEKGDFMNSDELITKFRSEVLVERVNILQNYANETKENGEAYYIYDNASKICQMELS